MVRTAHGMNQILVLDPGVTPVRKRIVTAILAAIDEGLLIDNDPLPSTRKFANMYKVSRSSVVEAYEELCGLGLAKATQGSYTRIACGAQRRLDDLPVFNQASRQGKARSRGASSVASAQAVGESVSTARKNDCDFHSRKVIGGSPRRCKEINLTVPATFSPSMIDKRGWNKAWKEAISLAIDFPAADVPCGTEQLSAALATYLRNFRGVVANPAHLVLRPTVGAVVAEVAAALSLRGCSIALSDPVYPRLQRFFIDAGCRIHSLPVDEEGLRVDMLSPEDRLIHVMPARQWPTGISMSMRRRHELLDWAQEHGAVILENDLDAEFSCGSSPLPTLHSLSAARPGPRVRVFYMGSPAKLISRDLGVVWLAVDDEFRRHFEEQAPVSQFTALALANYIQSGALSRHRNRALSLCEERRTALIAALRHRLPQLGLSGGDGGTELVIKLPAGVGDVAVQYWLAESGFKVSTLSDFAIRSKQGAIVVDYSDLGPASARRFANALADILAGVGLSVVA